MAALVLDAWNTAGKKFTSQSADSKSLAQAWETVTAALDPRTRRDPVQLSSDLSKAVRLLGDHHMKMALLSWYLESIREAFIIVRSETETILNRFENAGKDPAEIERLLITIVEWQQAWSAPINLFWTDSSQARSAYKRIFWSQVYSTLPPSFTPALSFYLRHLLQQPGARPKWDSPNVSIALNHLLDRYDPVLFSLVYEEIERKTETECKGVFDRSCLPKMLEWLQGPVLTWVSGLYAREIEGGTILEAQKMLKPTFSRFEYHISKILCRLRTEEMYDLIQAYPKSTPALEDFRACLAKSDVKDALVKMLRKQISTELLHPGSETREIIYTYISTIKCLRIIDPHSVVLSRVAEPIRAYLRTRDDTIRCIVSSLIGIDEGASGNSNAASESERNAIKEIASAADARLLQDAKDEPEHYGDPKWVPDPMDAPASYKQSRGSDILQLLVSIYDTKDIFVKELHVLLAQRLLRLTNYSLVAQETKNLEMLKARFGESSLAGCEVMLRDLQDSARDDDIVHAFAFATSTSSSSGGAASALLAARMAASRPQALSANARSLPLHATIVSRMFWPSLQNAPLKLAPRLARMRREYERAYTALKPRKRLKWLAQLGTVNIDVELSDRTLKDVSCTPLQATLIELFSRPAPAPPSSTQDEGAGGGHVLGGEQRKQGEWTIEDLCIETLVTDQNVVRNALYFWNNLGVVRSTDGGDTWVVVEKVDGDVEMTTHVVEDTAPAVQSVQAKQLEDMRVHWSYIRGMLTNLGTLPISRIHSTLNMLVPAYKGAGTTLDQLEAFLDQMQHEGLVERSGTTNWKIVKT